MAEVSYIKICFNWVCVPGRLSHFSHYAVSSVMPLCMIFVLAMFLNNHHYLKLLFFSSFIKNLASFQFCHVVSLLFSSQCQPWLQHPAGQAAVWSWGWSQWQSPSPSSPRRPTAPWQRGQEPLAASTSQSTGSQPNSLAWPPLHGWSVITSASPVLPASTRSSAVSKSKAKPTYNRLLWRSLWARSAWQRNSSYGSAGKLLYCNCTLYK